MVVVPNFSGLTTATAQSQIVSAGLKVSAAGGIRNTNVLAENGVSLSQIPAAGTLVDYETEVVITSGNYVADTVTVGPCQNYGTTTNDPDYCSGNLYVYGSARTKRRKTVTTTNNVTGTTTTTYDNSCTDDVVSRGSAYIDGQCGYVAPPTTCTYSISYGPYSACNARYQVYISGTQTRTVSGTNTNCQPFSYTQTITCYQAVCADWGPWSYLDIYRERRVQLCQRTDGSTYFNEQVRCKTSTSTTYTTCVNKKRTQITKYYACGKLIDTVYTYNLPCNAL